MGADLFFILGLGMVGLSVFVHYTMPNRITQCANYICVARNYNGDSLNVVEFLFSYAWGMRAYLSGCTAQEMHEIRYIGIYWNITNSLQILCISNFSTVESM